MATDFKSLYEELELSESFQKEKFKLEVLDLINSVMKRERVSRSELARRMETSRAYVTKLLNGNANMQFETVFKVAAALNVKPHMMFAYPDSRVHWLETLEGRKPRRSPFPYKREDFTNIDISKGPSDAKIVVKC